MLLYKFLHKVDKKGERKGNTHFYKLLYSMLFMLEWRLCDKRCCMPVQFIISPQTCMANISIAKPALGLQWGSPPLLNARHIQWVTGRSSKPLWATQEREIPTNQRSLLSANGWVLPFVSMTLVATDILGGWEDNNYYDCGRCSTSPPWKQQKLLG